MILKQEEKLLLEFLKIDTRRNKQKQAYTPALFAKKDVKYMKEKTLFFDLDDTLIKCSGYYDEVEDKVIKELCKYTKEYNYDELRKTFNIRQAENLLEYGYGPKNYILSLKQIAEETTNENYEKYNLAEYIEKECAILSGWRSPG